MNDMNSVSYILRQHNHDEEQLQVIKNNNNKLIVEAPAGFGKTTTLISMIKYNLLTNRINNYRKILCITFSINAANKMKNDFNKELKNKSDIPKSERIIITNFHGLCRSILRKYGYLIGIPKNIDFDLLMNMSTKNNAIYDSLDQIDKNILDYLDSSVIDSTNLFSKYIEKYNEIIKLKYISRNVITYNSILTLVLELFNKFENIRLFYSKYFSIICVDEFQDTNVLGLSIIKSLSGDDNRVICFGDQMQQIYKFQGAIPNLIDKLIEHDNYKYIALKHNYRFFSNINLKRLDKNLRTFTNDFNYSNINSSSDIKCIYGDSIKQEASELKKYIMNKKNFTIVMLFAQIKDRAKMLIKFIDYDLDVFDASFKNDSKEFIDFQKLVLNLYQSNFKNRCITKRAKKHFLDLVDDNFNNCYYKKSFLRLLNSFFDEAIRNYVGSDRSDFIVTNLDTFSLHHFINLVKSSLTFMTIHGAKGMEWDYVVLANFEQNEIPNFPSMKSIGMNNNENVIDVQNQNSDGLKSLLNLFYVASSRAKKDFIVSYSSEAHRKGYNGVYLNTYISCLADLKFINLKK